MRQTVGQTCGNCSDKIRVLGAGTWCPKCMQVFHTACLGDPRPEFCPQCNELWVEPSTLFVYGDFCPVCSVPNEPVQDRCAACRQLLRWGTIAEFKDHLAFLKSNSRGLAAGSLVKAAVGLATLVLTAAYVVAWVLGKTDFLLVFLVVPSLGLGLIGKALQDHRKSRRLYRFCRKHERMVE